MLSDINISHGSVATPLRCGEISNDAFIANFLLSVTVKKNLKIGHYLAKLWTRVWCLVFWTTVYVRIMHYILLYMHINKTKCASLNS